MEMALVAALRREAKLPDDLRVCLHLPICQYRSLPNKSAVYIIFNPPNEVLYIGRSKRLRTRWAGSHNYSLFKAQSHLFIAWYSVPQRYLREVEKALIESYRPEFNVHLNNKNTSIFALT